MTLQQNNILRNVEWRGVDEHELRVTTYSFKTKRQTIQNKPDSGINTHNHLVPAPKKELKKLHMQIYFDSGSIKKERKKPGKTPSK